MAVSLFARVCKWYRRSSAALSVPAGQHFPVVGSLNSSTFRHGIEIRNDSRTPLSFVLAALQEHAGLSYADASVAVAVCHTQGGVLILAETLESAEEIAGCIAYAAHLQSLPLECRAVTIAPGELQSPAPGS
jgi:ATP-dependent Clp protease adapter protein ClpS